MEDSNIKDLKGGNAEYRNLATNTFFSFLFNYCSLFFTFIYSFLLARLFSDEDWGFYILATNTIFIIVTITSLLPSGLNFALNYYIPRYLVLDEKAKMKSLIKNSIILKLILLIPVFIISIFIFMIFGDIFKVSLNDKVSLLFILSPLIFINSLNYILDAINRGFSRFNYNLLFLLMKNAIYIIPLLILYITNISMTVEIVAFIFLIAGIIPFSINSLFIFIKIHRIKPSTGEPDSFRNDVSKTFKYGKFIGITDLIERLWKDTQLQGIGFFISPEIVTGYYISLNYQKLSEYSKSSFQYPLLTSFTTLNTKENYEQASMVYKAVYKITLFLLLIISGILFFSTEFILDFVFLEDRLIYSNLLKLMLIASIFNILGAFLQTYLNSQYNVKISFTLKVIYMAFKIPLFFIGLICFGVEGAIILGLIIGNSISFVIQIFATYKYGKITLNIKKISLQYLTFFLSIVITIILKDFVFKNASFIFIQNLGLSLLKNLDFLSIGSFLIIFILLNLIFKIVNSTDINFVETLLNKDKGFDRIIVKILNLVKKFKKKD